MLETRVGGVLTTKTLSHREAVLPFLWSEPSRKLVSSILYFFLFCFVCCDRFPEEKFDGAFFNHFYELEFDYSF